MIVLQPFENELQAGILLGEDMLADSFIKELCVGWLQWIRHEAPNASNKVKLPASRLAEMLEKNFGWDCGAINEINAEIECASPK